MQPKLFSILHFQQAPLFFRPLLKTEMLKDVRENCTKDVLIAAAAACPPDDQDQITAARKMPSGDLLLLINCACIMLQQYSNTAQQDPHMYSLEHVRCLLIHLMVGHLMLPVVPIEAGLGLQNAIEKYNSSAKPNHARRSK
jgi:hypothetical protein